MLILKKLSASIRKKSAGTRKDKTLKVKETSKSVSIRKYNKTLPLKVNRNIIGALLTYSAKSGKVIDLEKALMYPLSPIPLNILNGGWNLLCGLKN